MILCEKCMSPMAEEYGLTSEVYDSLSKEIIDEEGKIKYDALPDLLVFACGRCGHTQQVFFDEIIKKIKDRVANIVFDGRLGVVFTSTDREDMSEDNGVSYCGICPGVIDDSGYCFNDVINQCIVRKVNKSK